MGCVGHRGGGALGRPNRQGLPKCRKAQKGGDTLRPNDQSRLCKTGCQLLSKFRITGDGRFSYAGLGAFHDWHARGHLLLEVLSSTSGYKLHEVQDQSSCCGMLMCSRMGTLSTQFPPSLGPMMLMCCRSRDPPHFQPTMSAPTCELHPFYHIDTKNRSCILCS